MKPSRRTFMKVTATPAQQAERCGPPQRCRLAPDAPTGRQPPRMQPIPPSNRSARGAPNVLIVLTTTWASAPQCIWRPHPHADPERLADDGLRYTRFHNCALCSPNARRCLPGATATRRDGRDHRDGEQCAGYTSVRPNTAATIAEVLRPTATTPLPTARCKPVWEVSTSGPFDHWPTGEGFEDFYGWVAAETNHADAGPGHDAVELPDDPDYHVTPDLVDHAIACVISAGVDA